MRDKVKFFPRMLLGIKTIARRLTFTAEVELGGRGRK